MVDWFKKYITEAKEELMEINVKVAKMLCGLLAGGGFFMCVLNFFMKSYYLTALTAVFAVCMLVSMILFMKDKCKRGMILAMAGIWFLMLALLVNGGGEGVSTLWMLLVPMLSMYLMGYYVGVIYSLALGIFITAYLLTPLNTFGYQYSQAYLTRFPCIYFFDTIMSLLIQREMKNYQKKLKETAKKAEAANRAKSDFLANMSHEIRTPMNAIMGMCELVLNEDDLNREVRDNCNNIYLAGKNLLGIINDLLDFSKIESGKMEILSEPYSVSSMLNDIINMVMARKGDKQIELMVDCDPNVPDRLCGDEVRIKQTVVNLLTNAVKYTTSGGVLFKISAREERYGVNLMVQVKDSGIGIKKENLGKIFGSFSQVDTKKNRSIEGSGLGLAISKCLVRDMGGVLHVKSEYGKGSEFTMVIPQKVLGEKKIICIEKKEDVNILWYIGFAKFRHSFVESTYRTILDNIGNGLDVKYLVCDTFEKTKKELEADKGYTHLFIAREEYLAEREFFNKLADKIQITVVQDRNNHVILKSSMRNIYKPFYSLPVGNVINGERLSFGGEIRHGAKERFVATKAKILVVDDNVMNLKVAIGLLKPYQMLMFTADSGKAAIEMVKKQEFDIIFMDHMMPDMDGVETLKFIRAMDGEYFKKVPIVALTANAVSGAREMFLREGFQDFVSKPIEMNAMERTLRHLLPPDKIESKEEGDGRYGK